MTCPRAFTFALLIGGLIIGCRSEPVTPNYVARVGNQYLTTTDVSEQLASLPLGHDTAKARQQIIERWVTNALLYREAERRNLRADPDVQKRLREQERSVLINELTTRLYATLEPTITDADVQAYYDRHREQLRLHEPFVHVFYLTTSTPDAAQSVQSILRAAADTLSVPHGWAALTTQHATNPARARAIAAHYRPESRLFGSGSVLRQQLRRLHPGETAPIFEIEGRYHVMHLIDRAAAGTIPEPAWIEVEIRRRLALRVRKQMYAREVERLRNEALARREVDIIR
jgi:hypothetical protein